MQSSASNLFQWGNFTLASGDVSPFKIDCDVLTDDDLMTCANMLANRLPWFYEVRGVPSGGLRLAGAMESFTKKDGKYQLVVDDVWTTGKSLSNYCKKQEYHPQFAAVLFARNPLPYWCVTLFQLSPPVNMGYLNHEDPIVSV